LTIGNQHSRASQEIFGIENLSGKNFPRLFKRLVPSKTYDTAQKYLNLVFKPHIEEATLGKFNPFKELEVHFDDAHGGLQTKYLDFQFKRIFEEKSVRQVMVTVSDVTERVKLEQQLRDSEEATQRQMEMMLDILHCDLGALHEFLDSAEENLRGISTELKGDSEQSLELEVDKQEEYRNLLNRIFRIMHTIKGNAAMIKLNVFEARAHEFEEKIMEVKSKRDLKGNDFLPITVALSEMLSYIQEVRLLMERMGEVQTQLAENFAEDQAQANLTNPTDPPSTGPAPAPDSSPPPAEDQPATKPAPAEGDQEDPTTTTATATATAARPKPVININGNSDNAPPKPAAPGGNTLVGMLGQLAGSLAEKYDKQVELEARDFQESDLPQNYKFALRDIVVQLVRNSVCHGIEPPEEREVDNKPVKGKIRLEMRHSDTGELIITVADDGRGLPAEKLRKKAVEMGRADADEIMTWDDNALYALIFDSGFSTAEEVTSDAGRGVGMDVVRETVAELGGHINVSSKAGKGCEFQLVLPEAPE
jgi:chemotaxis protein histidine kinase CheA